MWLLYPFWHYSRVDPCWSISQRLLGVSLNRCKGTRKGSRKHRHQRSYHTSLSEKGHNKDKDWVCIPTKQFQGCFMLKWCTVGECTCKQLWSHVNGCSNDTARHHGLWFTEAQVSDLCPVLFIQLEIDKTYWVLITWHWKKRNTSQTTEIHRCCYITIIIQQFQPSILTAQEAFHEQWDFQCHVSFCLTRVLVTYSHQSTTVLCWYLTGVVCVCWVQRSVFSSIITVSSVKLHIYLC